MIGSGYQLYSLIVEKIPPTVLKHSSQTVSIKTYSKAMLLQFTVP